ncbi:hypothetical protein AVEN_143909-1 [Araneus ventricosus]|uniref:Integrase zinc-binding domain-containing protein n=1 Tax=Araneus ventricosus TaxID=182803 RepID=A0A4Y2ELK8_ARAVE|nr:hypothetical protein AVEN_143909-1 [Araneus ventricosus]
MDRLASGTPKERAVSRPWPFTVANSKERAAKRRGDDDPDLPAGKGFISKGSSIYNLNPELDDNHLLQLKGRLEFSNHDVRAKHPWLLPTKDKFVKLLILDDHVKMCHLGVEGTLTHLREQFWIVKGRQFPFKPFLPFPCLPFNLTLMAEETVATRYSKAPSG